MNRNPEDQYSLVTSDALNGAYVLNKHLSESHPFLSILMLPLMAISGEKLSAPSASWDAFDNGHRRHLIETDLNITKASDDLLADLLEKQNEGLRGLMQVANAKGIPCFSAIHSYKDNLRQLEDRLIFR